MPFSWFPWSYELKFPLSIKWAAHVNASCFSPTVSSKIQRCSSSSFVGSERSKAAILAYTHPGCTCPSVVIRLFGLSTLLFLLLTPASWRQPNRCWDLLGLLRGAPRTKAGCLVGSWRSVCACVRGRFFAWYAAELSVMFDCVRLLLARHGKCKPRSSIDGTWQPASDLITFSYQPSLVGLWWHFGAVTWTKSMSACLWLTSCERSVISSPADAMFRFVSVPRTFSSS
jgi:hypothetical protein